jgi:hypothetical protein
MLLVGNEQTKQQKFHEAQSFSKKRGVSVSQIPRIVWNLQFYCRIYEIPRLVPVLSQIILFHAFPTDLFTAYDNSIL